MAGTTSQCIHAVAGRGSYLPSAANFGPSLINGQNLATPPSVVWLQLRVSGGKLSTELLHVLFTVFVRHGEHQGTHVHSHPAGPVASQLLCQHSNLQRLRL